MDEIALFAGAGGGLLVARVTVAALYVETDGVYFGVDGVDPWDETKDARKYCGPHPVVAHPPCERWGRYWSGGPVATVRRKLGDDDGCFAAAIEAVRMWGGVIEHPEGSHAWRRFGIPKPRKSGGWYACIGGGWTCCVEQRHYGHEARKATWLYVRGVIAPPTLIWGAAQCGQRLDDGFHTAEERRRAVKTGRCQRLSRRQRKATPKRFRDVLLGIARSAQSPEEGRPRIIQRAGA